MNKIGFERWFAQLEDVLDRCEIASLGPAEALSETYFLLETGPADVCGPIKPAISRAALQVLLESGAFESAALRLVGKCGYMLSRTNEQLAIASVVLPNGERDFSFSARSEAIALCGALATCLQEEIMTERRMDQMILHRRQA